MSYKLLIRKLEIERDKFVVGEVLKKYCKSLGLDYSMAVRYLLSNDYMVRIFRGIFYVKSIEERKHKKVNISFLEAIKEALKLKNITNWYFGLETAIKLNNLTHEYFVIDFVISDSLYRPRPFIILGHKIRFLKAKKELFGFGIKKKPFNYSDAEKTILDIIHFGKYNNLSDYEIENKIIDYLDKCDRKKILHYSKKYSKTVRSIVERLL